MASVQELARKAIQRLADARISAGQEAGYALPGGALSDFLAALRRGDADAGLMIVETIRGSGQTYPEVADTLFADAARALGTAWETDGLSFLDMSFCISTLFRVNSMTRRAHRSPQARQLAPIVFATLPDQRHTLGVILATEGFRQQGLVVDLLLDCSPEEIEREVRANRVGLVGLSAARQDRLTDILNLARTLKRCPNAPAIMVGGSAALDLAANELAGAVDHVARDLKTALHYAASLELSAC